MSALLLCQPVVSGMMYDVISPLALPSASCVGGCAAWSTRNATVNAWWRGGAPPANTTNECAQLSGAPALSKPSGPTGPLDPTEVGGNGAWCFCAGESKVEWAYCTSPLNTPEQINLQLASPTIVVASFVTFERSQPAGLPVASVTTASGGSPITIEGVTHTYHTPANDRTYYMHFVVLKNLTAKARYSYKVKSGGDGALWSEEATFRAPYDSTSPGPTTVAIFGDMGVYTWNNMDNLLADANAGDIDAVVHIGDHAYNMGGDDDRRGDGYMQAYSPIISTIPWIPIVGNHEYLDGDKLSRYLNQTEGTVVANPGESNGHPFYINASTTATTALGSLMSAANHHAAGVHGTTPSGTSRFFSVDLGIVHFVALDLNMYAGVDACGETCRVAQLKWLNEDLVAANANRANVPWIVAMSHFPLYCSNCPAPGHDPPAWYVSELCEFLGHDEGCVDPAYNASAHGASGGATLADMVPDFEPLFMKFGVDVYASGHIHDFEWIYPTFNNTAVQKNFTDPKAPVHLVTGNAGPPSAKSPIQKTMPWSYIHSNEYSYTRLIAHNASTMEWLQIATNDSRVIANLTITAESHGPFPTHHALDEREA